MDTRAPEKPQNRGIIDQVYSTFVGDWSFDSFPIEIYYYSDTGR
jgi:hypothetical protein